ncbi:hypothetical protein KEG38_30470 [Polyangium jinanense]|nr:hypothetical protein [Polyangium jinanense]
MLTEGGYIEENGNCWVRTGRQVFDPNKFYLTVEILDSIGNPTTITYDTHDLLMTSAEDSLGNTVTATNDYRVLGPTLVTDPNGNRSAVKLDELGMVMSTAVMGKVGSNDGDTLEDPTTTFEYDLDVWRTTGKPNVVHAAARERHGDALTPWQHSYTYLDGLGREILKKVQAEPGPAPVRDENGGLVKDENGAVVLATASPRWVGTGRVVIDNKGNPVKQYEPFFTATHEYEDEKELVEWGVTPILRYDPLGRLIQTDLPNGTHSRVTFTPWEQASWDGNDTVLETGNPWYAARQPSATPTPSTQEQRAAELTEEHAGTPALVHFDVLGRPVRGVEDNGGPEPYTTKAVLDIEGNPRKIVDARGNTAMEYVFDMLGRTLYQKSCDSGERRTLANVLGNPIRGWDGRGHVVRSVYDALNRPTGLWVQKGSDPEVLAEVTVYGEGQTDPEDANLRGKVYQVKDGAGVVTSVEYDFKGNLLESQRQLAQNYSTQLDWSGTVALETEVFTQSTAYDALNRPTSLTMPDQSEIKPTYNEASLLEKVEARIRGASAWTTFVDDIDYDAKGQREKIVYGNGVITEYSYDPLTYRLTRLKTTRTSGSELLQDLRYTYDPVGNIVEIADLAQDELYHNSELVEPVWKYEYDAIYRLIVATGREHSGQNSDIQQDQNGFPLVNAANPNDPQAMRNYAESFEYDAVGNILKMIHAAQGSTGSWTRRYDIAATSNRLLGTSLPGDDETEFSATYTYDEHGSMTSVPHLDGIVWDFKDQKREVDKGGGGTVYFTYDAGGQRVRKVWEHSGIVEERIYLGAFEVYRRHELGGVVLERETLHVMDDARRIMMVETKTVDASDPNLVVTSRVRYQLGNHLGSAALELDEDGLVISYEEYHPYGTTAYHAVASGVEVSAKRYRYTGKEKDEETGLYYHGARYYAPWLGRWTAADPAGMVDGPGLYTYVNGNPIRLIDPSGTDAQAPRLTQEQIDALRKNPPTARIPKGARVGYLNQPGHKAGTYVKGGTGTGQPPKPQLPPSPPSPPPSPPAPPGSGRPGDADVPKGSGEHHGPGGKGTGNAEGNGTSAESGASDRTHLDKLAEKLALLAGIVNSELDHNFSQEGASPYGIVGGKSTSGPQSSVLQMAASGIQMGATLVVQGLVKAFNAARSLASRLRMLPGPKPTKLLAPPKWRANQFASQKKLDKHFDKHKHEWGAGNITKEGYAKRARNLLNSDPVPGGDVLGFTPREGTRFRYNVRTNEFATGKPDGTIETLFRPEVDGMAYWKAQVEKYGP